MADDYQLDAEAARHQLRAPSRVDELLGEVARLKAENAYLRGTVDILSAPPRTAAEVEAELDSLPELDDDDRAAVEAIDIEAIIRAATDPDNATPEWMLRKMIDGAKQCPGFDPALLAETETYLDRRFRFA